MVSLLNEHIATQLKFSSACCNAKSISFEKGNLSFFFLKNNGGGQSFVILEEKVVDLYHVIVLLEEHDTPHSSQL